jgi:hypothetical protein
VQQLAKAVHMCPWHAHARARLVQQALSANLRNAPAIYRAAPVPMPEAAAADSSSSNGSSTCVTSLRIPDVLAAASSRAVALSAQVAVAVAHVAGQEVCRLQRLLHALPDSPDVRYCLALAALQQAIGDGQAGHFRTALRCCTSALARVKALLRKATAAAGGNSSSSSSGAASTSLLACDASALQEVQVRLMVAISECYQHSRLPGCHDAAHHWAMDALAAAMAAGGGSGSAAATAHRQVGRMLASEGMVVEAEMTYRQAAAAASGDVAVAAQLELAKLLLTHGRAQEAAQLLHSIWQGPADELAAAAAAPQQLPAGCSNFVEAAALEEALLLADLGQLDAARAAAAAGMSLAAAAGEAAPAAAELVTTTVALQAGEAVTAAGGSQDAARNLLLEARWAASSAAKSGLALPGTVGTAAAGVSAAVLAQVELRRGKPDRAIDALGMAFGASVDRAVPAQVLIAAGQLSGELSDCASAVHTAPWLGAGWQQLQLAAVAVGRPMLL